MKKKQAHMISLLTLPDPSLHYSLELKYIHMCTHTHTHTHTYTTSAMEVMDFNLRLFELLFTSPQKVLPLFDQVLARLLHTLHKSSMEADQLVRPCT